MAKWSAIVLLCLALGAAAVQADDVTAALNKKGLKLAASIFEISGVSKKAAAKGARWTAFAPTDAAVTSFLSDMGLTVDDLKARPGLARQIVGVHLVLRHNVRAQELFANGDVRIVNSAAGANNNLVFTKVGDKVTVTAAQGVTANVEPEFITLDDQRTVHVIDKVLFGSKYYTSFATLCADRAFTISSFCEAADYAGLTSTLADGFDHTVFVPNNAAFVAAGINLGSGTPPTPAAVADILKYHVLAGAAKGIERVAAGDAETLAGKTVAVSFTKTTKNGLPVRDAFVNGAKVLVSNVYVSKTIVNGIGAVLQPGVITASASTTERAASTTAASSSSSSDDSNTFTFGKGGSTLKITLPKIQIPVVKKTTTAATTVSSSSSAAVSAGKGSSGLSLSLGKGRKLLDFGWGFDAGQQANDDQTESEITNAVDGNISAAAASDSSILTSEELSVPGDWNQVDNGVNPW